MNRNSVVDYIGRLRTKPEHIRQRIALGTAVGTTAVVACAWLFFVLSSGTLAINPQPASGKTAQEDAYANTQIQQATTQTKNGFQELLGAVGFAQQSASTAPALTAVNVSTSTPVQTSQSDNQSPTGGSQTVIPF